MSIVDHNNQLRRRSTLGTATTWRRWLTEEVPKTANAMLLYKAQPGKHCRDFCQL